MRKGTRTYGSLSVTDPAAQRQYDKAMREFIRLDRLDDAAKLDLTKLLDPKALTPVTDNPDEAAYLAQVRKSLDANGVWLRLAPKRRATPTTPRVGSTTAGTSTSGYRLEAAATVFRSRAA